MKIFRSFFYQVFLNLPGAKKRCTAYFKKFCSKKFENIYVVFFSRLNTCFFCGSNYGTKKNTS